MDSHNHDALRGHISQDSFRTELREMWYSTTYREALRAHHDHSNDRPSLLSLMAKLNRELETEFGFFSRQDTTPILDIGCGAGEVATKILEPLDLLTQIEYFGIDKSYEVLASAQMEWDKSLGESSIILLREIDYSKKCWSSKISGKNKFKMIWLIHSGYYLKKDHISFLQNLEKLIDTRGIIFFIHNIEGNRPFLSAARQLGMHAYQIRYKRYIRMPKVPRDVFEVLRSDPGDLEKFSRRFSLLPEVRALRLMLEFYLPDYPLEALTPEDRDRYVINWENLIKNESGQFRDDHELLLLLHRQQADVLRNRLENLMRSVFKHERGTNLFRHYC